jgi:hypothetical protein
VENEDEAALIVQRNKFNTTAKDARKRLKTQHCFNTTAVILALCLGFTFIFIPLSLVGLLRNVRKGCLSRIHRNCYVEQLVDDVVIELLPLTLDVDAKVNRQQEARELAASKL